MYCTVARGREHLSSFGVIFFSFRGFPQPHLVTHGSRTAAAASGNTFFSMRVFLPSSRRLPRLARWPPSLHGCSSSLRGICAVPVHRPWWPSWVCYYLSSSSPWLGLTGDLFGAVRIFTDAGGEKWGVALYCERLRPQCGVVGCVCTRCFF